jgi:hypothetical protein
VMGQLKIQLTNPYRIKVVDMEFEKDVLSKDNCEAFILQSNHIILRGFVAIDFHSAASSDSLIFHPLPDTLMEHLDLIKKPSLI